MVWHWSRYNTSYLKGVLTRTMYPSLYIALFLGSAADASSVAFAFACLANDTVKRTKNSVHRRSSLTFLALSCFSRSRRSLSFRASTSTKSSSIVIKIVMVKCRRNQNNKKSNFAPPPGGAVKKKQKKAILLPRRGGGSEKNKLLMPD